MSESNHHVIESLEDLIEVCRDGQNGYRDGAEHVKDPELKKFMDEVSLERAKFAGDLETEVIRLGKSDVERSGSTLGAIHRGWTDSKGEPPAAATTPFCRQWKPATAMPRTTTRNTSMTEKSPMVCRVFSAISAPGNRGNPRSRSSPTSATQSWLLTAAANNHLSG